MTDKQTGHERAETNPNSCLKLEGAWRRGRNSRTEARSLQQWENLLADWGLNPLIMFYRTCLQSICQHYFPSLEESS